MVNYLLGSSLTIQAWAISHDPLPTHIPGSRFHPWGWVSAYAVCSLTSTQKFRAHRGKEACSITTTQPRPLISLLLYAQHPPNFRSAFSGHGFSCILRLL